MCFISITKKNNLVELTKDGMRICEFPVFRILYLESCRKKGWLYVNVSINVESEEFCEFHELETTQKHTEKLEEWSILPFSVLTLNGEHFERLVW